jgi:hypothetical protein
VIVLSGCWQVKGGKSPARFAGTLFKKEGQGQGKDNKSK